MSDYTLTVVDGSTSTGITVFDGVFDGSGGGGEGAVDSVDGRTGDVTLSDRYQPLDSDLTAIAALTTTLFGRSLLAAADAAAARTLTGAGTSSLVIGTSSTTAKAGNYAPAAADISDASTIGKTVLTAASAAAIRTALGLGSAALSATTAFDAAGSAAAAQAASQPLDSDLTAIAALSTTTFGRSLLTAADAAAARSTIGAGTSSFDGAYSSLTGTPTLGDAAAKNTGTTTGTVAAGDDSRITGAVQKSTATTKGDIFAASASATVNRLAVGSDGQVLTADAASTNGVKWSTPSSGFADPTTTKGDLIVHGASTTRLGVGSNNQVLTADSAQTAGVKWSTPVTVATDTIFDAKGDLAVGTGADTAAKLTVGSNDTVLMADSSQTTGQKWQALDDSYVAPVAPNDQTGTTYTFVLADGRKLVTASNASAQTYTVPPNSSVAYPLGTVLSIVQKGAGQVTLAQGSGVTLNSAHGLKTSAQWAMVSLTKILTDTWVVSGDTTT